MRSIAALLMWLAFVSAACLIVLMGQSCSSTSSASLPRVETVVAPLPDYRCFVIYGPDGKACGGNCVREVP